MTYTTRHSTKSKMKTAWSGKTQLIAVATKVELAAPSLMTAILPPRRRFSSARSENAIHDEQ